MNQKDVNLIVARLLDKPTYMKSGSGLLSRLWDFSQDDIVEAKRIARETLPPYRSKKQTSQMSLGDKVKRLVIGDKETEPILPAEIEEEIVRKIDELKGTIESHVTTNYEPKNHRELARLHKIDLTQYRISTYWSKQKSNGRFTSSVLCSLIRPDEDIKFQKDILLEEVRKYSFKSVPISYGKKSEGCLLEISIPDLHIGKLAHHSETGEDYDSSIAVKRFKDAIKEILSRVNLSTVSRIHLPIGNDLINVDSEANLTTAGTPQSCDTRFSKMVQTTRRLLVDTINELSQIAPVDVTVVQGNHDSQVSFLIGEILDAWFHNNPNVTINNSPKWRKYYEFGNNSFLLVHGDKEKHGELGLIFATEEPELWARTKFRFCKLGHLHKSKQTNWVSVDTHQGFQVNILPSLSGTDAWHSSRGYLGLKQAKGYLYHPTQGEIAQYTYTV